MKKSLILLFLLLAGCTIPPLVEKDKMTADELLLVPPEYDVKPEVK